jgi:uncharacterized protein YecE (DUF72 family)
MGRIRVGNSGWSYDDWIGPFYPERATKKELLRIYFSRFETVEVNSTFYHVPAKGTVISWAREATNWDKRELTIKLPSRVSHDLCMKEEPDEFERELDRFKEIVIDPLVDHGSMGALLFQASPYFSVRGDIKYKMKSPPKVPLPEYSFGIKRLSEIGAKISSLVENPVIEFRNSSWLTEDLHLLGEARDILRENGVALAVVDGPSFPWFSEETSRHNYIRFHGRNKEAWFKGVEDDPSARYLYDYSAGELGERLDPIRIMASKVDQDTRIYFNNHPKGLAPNNAQKLMELLNIQRPSGPLDRFW